MILNINAQNSQVKDSTPDSLLLDPPKAQAATQHYLNMTHNFPQSLAALTPMGISNDQGIVEKPVDNSQSMLKQPLISQTQPVDNFEEDMKKYDMRTYNTVNPQYRKLLKDVYNSIPEFSDPKAVDNYIQTKFKGSQITSTMLNSAAINNKISVKLLSAIAELEGRYGLAPRAMRDNNTTGYGELDNGSSRRYANFQENLNHTAAHLARLAN